MMAGNWRLLDGSYHPGFQHQRYCGRFGDKSQDYIFRLRELSAPNIPPDAICKPIKKIDGSLAGPQKYHGT